MHNGHAVGEWATTARAPVVSSVADSHSMGHDWHAVTEWAATECTPVVSSHAEHVTM